ncbi:MAG: lipopolysaccharide heptosyltransferase II [Planctomycetia bacterium]|nr:lipopolysaccharide heptosyltransferase II [Planctomycetia bacterium]
MKIGIFIPNWIGDVAMATPTLRALRRHYGAQAELVGILRPYVADVLAGTPWLDEQIFYHPKSKNQAERTWSVLSKLRRRRLDTIILLTNSLRAGALAWACGARERVGYVRYGRGPLLTHKLYYPRQGRKYLPTPAIDAYLQLAYAVGCERESPQLELATLPADEAAAEGVWGKWGLPLSNQVVVLNSGGAYGAAKLWPSESFAQLARRIATEQGLSVLVLCGPAERSVARQIVQLADHPRVVSLADELISIGLSKACIRRSRLLVTTDSGPRFFAVAFGVPVVSLFGPTHMQWTRTHYSLETCLQHTVPCGPCSRRTCPLGHHDCMRLLGVEQVYAAVLEQLDQVKMRAA